MASNCIDPHSANDFASKDTNRIVGGISRVLAYRSPWVDVLSGGTLEAGISDTVRSVVQERAALGHSLAAPVFTADISMCSNTGLQDITGTTEYTYQLGTLRGRGPTICIKQARNAFADAYERCMQALEKATVQLINADIRSTLHLQSGVKYVVNSNKNFYTNMTGDSQAIATQFAQYLPNGALTFQNLQKMSTFLREEMLATPFDSSAGEMWKFIGSADIIENFRNELGVKADLNYLTTGRYELGGKTLQAYQFEGPYRGIIFGIDQQPLRASGFDGNGNLILIEPEINVSTTKGQGARRNPAWINADYEVAFLMGDESFERLVPESYVGEGKMKFSPQLAMGELEWTNIRDNDCNIWGDYGFHIYQISRAYRPMRPQNVIPILFKRCVFQSGVTYCSTVNGI